MKKRSKSIRLLAIVLLSLLGGVSPARPQTALALDKIVVAKVYPGVVQLYGVANTGGSKWTPLYVCSGTIVSPQGYILTNHHCTDVQGAIEEIGDARLRSADTKIEVLLTKKQDAPPVASFFAEVVADSPRQGGMDLAVLRIAEDLSGQPVDNKSLNLPFVPLGDSDQVDLGDKLDIFGYPAIGGDTITFTSGDVSGFSFERGVDGRASISGGNSGGTAVDELGNLIGVPTQGGDVDCRQVADTNGDGVIDNRDSCVPIGGFINQLRPVNLAKTLIQQAESGVGPNPTPRPTNTPGPSPGGKAGISRLFFSDGHNEDDQPVSLVTSLPSGSRNVDFFFDYIGFQQGVKWQPRVFLNNTEIKDVWQEEPWDSDTHGNWWVGFKDANLDDGNYMFQVDYDGKSLGSASIQIGGRKTNNPTFANIAFSGGGKNGYVLPADITSITGDFEATNMRSGLDWRQVWYMYGTDNWTKVSEASGTWTNGGKKNSVTLNSPAPLDPGQYRLELYLSNQMAATADLTLAGDKSSTGSNAFGPITFADGQDKNGNPVHPGTSFPSGIAELHGFFDYKGLRSGQPWNVTWLLDGEEIINSDHRWTGRESGTYDTYINSQKGQLPDGSYELKLSLQGQLLQTGKATIGNGSAPVTPTPSSNGGKDSIKLTGTVVDADTGKPIAGAVVVVVKEGVTWSTFDGRDDQVLDQVETDSNGAFEVPTPLLRGKSYSIGVAADGYQADAEDGVQITNDLPDVVNTEIKLQQQ